MILRIFGAQSTFARVRQDMTNSSQRVEQSAHRIANASTPGFGEFVAGAEPVDVEAEMVEMADAQLRFQAAGRMLQHLHQQLRTGVRGNR